jgi:hypothetical protein
MFHDLSSDVHVIYMRCCIMYLVMFYGVFSVVHLVYMWRPIVYILGCLKSIHVIFFLFFSLLRFFLCFALDFIIIYLCYVFIFFCHIIMNLN